MGKSVANKSNQNLLLRNKSQYHLDRNQNDTQNNKNGASNACSQSVAILPVTTKSHIISSSNDENAL
jgi:hypothetical protein